MKENIFCVKARRKGNIVLLNIPTFLVRLHNLRPGKEIMLIDKGANLYSLSWDNQGIRGIRAQVLSSGNKLKLKMRGIEDIMDNDLVCFIQTDNEWYLKKLGRSDNVRVLKCSYDEKHGLRLHIPKDFVKDFVHDCSAIILHRTNDNIIIYFIKSIEDIRIKNKIEIKIKSNHESDTL